MIRVLASIWAVMRLVVVSMRLVAGGLMNWPMIWYLAMVLVWVAAMSVAIIVTRREPAVLVIACFSTALLIVRGYTAYREEKNGKD